MLQMGAFDLHTPYTTNQLEHTHSVCIRFVNNSTLGPAALGCRAYQSDTNLMGVLQLLLVNFFPEYSYQLLTVLFSTHNHNHNAFYVSS